MFNNVLLESEQKDLLTMLVEATRNVGRQQRQEFVFTEDVTGPHTISHPGLPSGSIEAYKGDIEILARNGLIAVSHASRGLLLFDVMPEGSRYYEEMKQQGKQPIQRVEQSVKSFLATEHFQKKYAPAYEKWIQAESVLWASESENQLTTIGHLCREALQEFASILINEYHLPNNEKEKALTVARLKAVISVRASQLGAREKEFLDALLAYWGTVSDLIQRQEHGSQREGETLIWEDGRRVVFQTLMVMFEVDRSLSRSQ